MIELHGIHKYYHSGGQPLHVLKGVDLHIREGELVSIMGSSGSGKSTLLNILGILDAYDNGTYVLDGQPVKKLAETSAARLRNKMLGFVFQSFNLLPFKNAAENVALPLYYQGVGRRERIVAPRRSWISSDSPIDARSCPTSCRAARSSASPSRARWCTSPR